MSLSYPERSRKLRIVAHKLGYLHPINLLYDYKDKEIVPGICVNESDPDCNNITNVERNEEMGHCINCDAYSVTSIMVLAGVV